MFEKGEKLFSEMKETGMHPSVHVYTVMIAGYAQTKSPIKPLKLIEEMLEAEVSPNIVTYNSLIQTCEFFGRDCASYVYQACIDTKLISHWKGNSVDFHKFNTAMMRAALRVLFEEEFPRLGRASINVVTGVGNNSDGGESVLGPAFHLEMSMHYPSYSVSPCEGNPGSFIVSLPSP